MFRYGEVAVIHSFYLTKHLISATFIGDYIGIPLHLSNLIKAALFIAMEKTFALPSP